MKTARRRHLQFGMIAVLGAYGLCACWQPVLLTAQSTEKPSKTPEKPPLTSDDQERTALTDAFASAQGNPQTIIKNLSKFLDRYPQTSRRAVVLRTICSYGAAANAPLVIIQYGQMLLQLTPDDPKLLNLVVDALSRENDQPSRNLEIDYTSRLIHIAEAGRTKAALPGTDEDNPEPWAQRVSDSYARRGQCYRDSGNIDKAISDYEMSYAAYPSSHGAEVLGDLAVKKEQSSAALNYYVTAFAFPDRNPDPVRRQEIRRKLSSLYVAQHGSENGLGDLVLSRYDELMPKLADRFSTGPPQNTGVQDPFKFVLERLDGSPLPLANYRGKVLVIDFWATWCGPCRVQGQIVDRVAQTFHGEPNVAFLSLNVDDDRSAVAPFLKQVGWTLPMAYAQGLNQLLSVSELPTLVIFGRNGEMVFRENGLDPGTFGDELTHHVRESLRETGGSKQ